MTTKKTSSETSLSLVLKTLCCDEELSDLTLEGIDGGKIPVNRCVLAARSMMFRGMLYGQYRESGELMISIGYKGEVLKAIKEYCYTDHAGIFDQSPCDESWALTMMQLAGASDYCGLPMLQKKIFDIICSKMKDEPALSCVIIENAEVGGDAAEVLNAFALDVLRSQTQDAMLPRESSLFNGVVSWKPETLTKVLQDAKLYKDQIIVFRALKAWSEANEFQDKENVPNLCSRNRQDIAVEMMKHVDLKRIKASDLSSCVKPSGAFEAQALKLERSATIPGWDVTNDTLFEPTVEMGPDALLKHDRSSHMGCRDQRNSR